MNFKRKISLIKKRRIVVPILIEIRLNMEFLSKHMEKRNEWRQAHPKRRKICPTLIPPKVKKKRRVIEPTLIGEVSQSSLVAIKQFKQCFANAAENRNRNEADFEYDGFEPIPNQNTMPLLPDRSITNNHDNESSDESINSMFDDKTHVETYRRKTINNNNKKNKKINKITNYFVPFRAA